MPRMVGIDPGNWRSWRLKANRVGISGLRTVIRALSAPGLRVVFTTGVVHLPSAPADRNVNRVDIALAMHDQAGCRRCHVSDVSFILLDLGCAFTAAPGVDVGRSPSAARAWPGPASWLGPA